MATDVNPPQPLKADVPIVVTEFPIVMDVKTVQSEKADDTIDETLLPNINVLSEDFDEGK